MNKSRNITSALLVLAGLVGGLGAAPVYASQAAAGFSGKVVSVDAAANSFTASVRLVYAGTATAGVGAVLPPGKTVVIVVPSTATVTDARGNPITLASVNTGAFFNAAVFVDTVAKTATASKIVFGNRVSAPSTRPSIDDTQTPPASTTTTIPPTTTTTTPPAQPPATPPGQTNVNFAGKVNAVDVSQRTITVTFRAVYGTSASGVRAGAIVPGTQFALTVPESVPITRLGVPITLADVAAGDLFNARATLNRAAKTGVAASIQVLSPSVRQSAFSGKITAASEISVTVASGKQVTETFAITPTTKIYLGRNPGTAADLLVGRTAVVSFAATAGGKQAAQIVVASEGIQVKIDRLKEKFFAVEAIERRGEHAVNYLGATLDRFDNIIAKQETTIGGLREQGKNTAAADASLAVSKTDSAAARAAVSDASAKFGAISGASDPQAAAEAAQKSLRAAVAATKKVLQDIRNTQREIKAISQ